VFGNLWKIWTNIAGVLMLFYLPGDNLSLFYLEPSGDLPARTAVMFQLDGMDFTDSARAICARREATSLFNPSLFCDNSTEQEILERGIVLFTSELEFLAKLAKTSADWSLPN